MANVLVVYFSGTGNTEIMAEKIAEGLENVDCEVELKAVADVDASDLEEYDKVAFGCPSMGDEVLEEESFEPFFAECEEELIKGKKVALFGSYDWGTGQWMKEWEARVKDAGAKLYKEGLIINLTPDSEGEEKCVKLGEGFGKF